MRDSQGHYFGNRFIQDNKSIQFGQKPIMRSILRAITLPDRKLLSNSTRGLLSEYSYRLSLLMKCFSFGLAYFFIVSLFFNAIMQNS